MSVLAQELDSSSRGGYTQVTNATVSDEQEPSFIQKHRALLYLAEQCMPNNPGLIPQVLHITEEAGKDVYDFYPAFAYLVALQAFCENNTTVPITEDVHQIFNTDGTWKNISEIFPTTEYGPQKTLHQMSLEELRDFMCYRLSILYQKIADASLNSLPATLSTEPKAKWGFNEHGLGHISRVEEMTMRLLQDAEVSDEVLRRAIVAVWAHDLGNVLCRPLHALISPKILLQMIPELGESFSSHPVQTKRNVLYIKKDIYFHNEKTIGEYIRSWNEASLFVTGRELTESDIIEIMRYKFTEEAFALFLADKADLGPERETLKPQDDFMEIDPHRQVNVNASTTYLGLSPDKKAFNWILEFDPGDKPRYPQEFEAWISQFWGLYIEKNLMMARSAFALYPDITEFTILVIDNSGRHSSFTFTKDNLRENIKELKKRYPKIKKTKQAPQSEYKHVKNIPLTQYAHS